MIYLRIIIMVLCGILFVLGCSTISKTKKSENKKIKELKKELIPRINIMIFLTVIISIMSIIMIIFNNK